MLRGVGARRRRRRGRGGWSLLYGDTPVVSPGGRHRSGRAVAASGDQPGRSVHRAARRGRGGDRVVRAQVPRAVRRNGALPGGLQRGGAWLSRGADGGRHGHLPRRVGDHEPGLLPAHPPSSAVRAGGARRVLVPGPVRGRIPAGRGRVRDPVVEERLHDAGRHLRARRVGAQRVAGRRLPAGAVRIRVQGRAGSAARVAARGAPGRARRRVGVPVRRGREDGRVRHHAVRVPARSAGRPGPA